MPPSQGYGARDPHGARVPRAVRVQGLVTAGLPQVAVLLLAEDQSG